MPNFLSKSGLELLVPSLTILKSLANGVKRSRMWSQPLDVGETIRILWGGEISFTWTFLRGMKLSEVCALEYS